LGVEKPSSRAKLRASLFAIGTLASWGGVFASCPVVEPPNGTTRVPNPHPEEASHLALSLMAECWRSCHPTKPPRQQLMCSGGSSGAPFLAGTEVRVIHSGRPTMLNVAFFADGN